MSLTSPQTRAWQGCRNPIAAPARAPSPRRFIQDTCGCVSSTIATGNTTNTA